VILRAVSRLSVLKTVMEKITVFRNASSVFCKRRYSSFLIVLSYIRSGNKWTQELLYKRYFTLIPCNLLLYLYRYEDPKVEVERKILAKTSLFQLTKLSKINNNNNNKSLLYYSEKKKSDMAVGIWKTGKVAKVAGK